MPDDLVELCRIAVFDSKIELRRSSRAELLKRPFETGPADKALFELLAEALKSVDTPNRFRAAELIGCVEDVEMQDKLFLQSQKDPSWTVRELACKSMGRALLRDPESVDRRLEQLGDIALRDREAMVRCSAVQAIIDWATENLSDSRLVKLNQKFEQTLNAKQLTHRKRSLEALGRIGSVTSVPRQEIARMIDDSHVKIRKAACRAIMKLIEAQHDFEFALPRLLRRSYDTNGLDGNPARDAIRTAANKLPNSIASKIAHLTPPKSHYQPNRNNLTACGRVIGLTRNWLEKCPPEVQASYKTTCSNRIEWAKQQLPESKSSVVEHIALGEVPRELKEPEASFAIKETAWLLSKLIELSLDSRN